MEIDLEYHKELKFETMPVSDPPPKDANEGCVIAFVPKEGFQWSQYYNGSKTWFSIVKRETIEPTMWLKKKD